MVYSVVRDRRVLTRLAEKDGEQNMGRQRHRRKKWPIKTEKKIKIGREVDVEN